MSIDRIFAFRRFRSRLLVLFIALFAAIGLVTISLLQEVHETNAKEQISVQTAVAADVLQSYISHRIELLTQSSYALSRDHAFLGAFSTNDKDTVRSAMESLRNRVGASLVLLASASEGNTVLVDSLGSALVDQPFPISGLIEAVEDTGRPVTTFAVLLKHVYNLTVVPLLAPDPIAWLCMGYQVDNRYLRELADVVRCDVSILSGVGTVQPTVLASTLDAASCTLLAAQLVGRNVDSSPEVLLMGRARTVVCVHGLEGNEGLFLVVQRSLDEAMEPFNHLQRILWGVAAAGLLIALIGIYFVARQVSQPLKALADQARLVQEGEFGTQVNVTQLDEVGRLAGAFNEMTRGLADKQRIHDLLGKVVSPAIAVELLRNQEIQLGGEEREVTILFMDIRNFTPLCEGHSPTQVLDMLNFYLTRMSEVIGAHGGVVDKFIGDAIMAIFGAPLRHDDDPDRAVRAALKMAEELGSVMLALQSKGFPPFRIGIGINTDVVMVGNMGSKDRLNYTVIGDGVNVASRLESATKELGHLIVISDATLKKTRGRYITEDLGLVMVKGKSQGVRAHAVLALAGD